MEFSHLEVWAPNMFPAEAEPLPLAAFHPPPAWTRALFDPTPPCGRQVGGGPTAGQVTPAPPVPPPCLPSPPPPRPRPRLGWA